MDETQYLRLMEDIMSRGSSRMDRTGVGTRAIFGTAMRFDLSNGTIPIFTTKKVLWKAALVELLWFLSGSTSIRPLVAQNVHIWTDWPLKKYREASGHPITREAFEQRILHDDEFSAEWGDLGPVYGRQWRHWETKDGRVIDQIASCMDMLRVDPYSRRILFHGWNVGEIAEMALPPCHLLYQFGVSDGRLNLILYQRSVDILLGCPFNIASAGFLLCMAAQQSGLEPGELQWFGGDTHLYDNHIEQAKEQLTRAPRAFPTLSLARKPDSIDDYRVEDFVIEGYDPHGFIKAPVAV